MRRLPSNSVRSVAFATVFCALGIASGCGRETFDLLPEDSLVNSAGQAGGAGKKSGGAGNGGSAASAGKGGGAGKAEAGGFGGRITTLPGGGGSNLPCLGEAGCADEDPTCTEPSLFCFPCNTNTDCAPLDAFCDQNTKYCVQCNEDFRCGPGEACNLKTHRCAKACDANNDNCNVDGQHLQCNRELNVCVACLRKEDCNMYAPYNPYCYLNSCVECIDERQCAASQSCFAGHCVKH